MNLHHISDAKGGADPENTEMWQEIEAGEEINKTVSALKIVNNGAACSVVVRIIMC